jgi:hypothetical protein
MTTATTEREEYLTIIAPTAGEAMAQFKARGLDVEGYSIAGKIGRHQFALVTGDTTSALFSGGGMFAATFRRTVTG